MRSKTSSDNFWSFGWPLLGTHVYKMTPTALDYYSISYGAHDQCAPFDTVRITSILRTNRRFSVKLANYRKEAVIYRREKLASSHFTYITHYCQRANSRKLQLNNSIIECDFEESKTVLVQPVLNEIVSLATLLGLEVDLNDITELMEEQSPELTIKELIDLDNVSQ
ncbi:hypothetical protein TNCV_2645311 [Trichonephila clavipes]|nr:hypothetical protein TNCV_2645311 [Trichonephila clavipes]